MIDHEQFIRDWGQRQLQVMREYGVMNESGKLTTTDAKAYTRAYDAAYKQNLIGSLCEAPTPLESDWLDETRALTPHQYLPYWLAMAAPYMTAADRYHYTIDAYICAPYGSIPKQSIRDLRNIRPEDYLPDWLEEDPVKVYRGGGHTANQAFNSISWTTDIKQACFFYDRARKHNADNRLWQGFIKRSNIIAATNDRGEWEVMQYRSVKLISSVELTEEQLRGYLEERKREMEKAKLLDGSAQNG